jgi:predicted DNA-binding transcriptional regulator YafY
VIHPLHLAYLEHRWMLIAHDVTRGARRNFLLGRTRDVRPTGASFTPPARLDLEKSLRSALGRFVGETEPRERFRTAAAGMLARHT